MNKNKVYLPLFIAIAIAFGVFIGSFLDYPEKDSIGLFNSSPQEAKIKRLINFIQYEYVEEVDTDSLLNSTITNLLSKLDPHSIYIPANEQAVIAERMNGEFEGIGVQFRMINDSLTVINVVKGGPSEKAGLEDGDRILTANEDTLSGKKISNEYIMKTLKGKAKTRVNVTVYRKSQDKVLDFSIKRGKIPVKSVDTYYMLNDSLGYIKMNKFANTSYDEFKVALNSLQKQNLKCLVLDLRGNGGGYMGVATRIVDEFLEDDKLIVFTKNKGGQIDESFATSKGDFEDGNVYVLMDENSASASEIVAGALQDNDKGTIVGRRSFGKGLVQQEMDLGDGSSVRLTVSRYYTPTGRSIQKPYEGEDGKSYFNDLRLRYRNGEMINGDSIKVNDSLKFVTPKGKTVYGGGGIVPDSFVSIDTSAYIDRAHSTLLSNFVFEYVDNHRDEVKTWVWQDFLQNFDNDGQFFKRYSQYFNDKLNEGREESRKREIKIPERSAAPIKIYLKALFAQMAFDDTAFYKIVNQDDKMIERVRELETQIDYIKH